MQLHITHVSQGRVRLRTAEGHPVEERFFDELRRSLGTLQGVREVRTNARTGSVLVLHEEALERLLERLRELELVTVVPQAARTPMLRLQAALQQAEARLAKRTHGTITLGSLTFAAMALAGLVQTGRGRLLPAGMTLLEYAYDAMNREAERERMESRGRR